MTDGLVYVLAECADGPVFIPHTPTEFAALMDGVDVEAAWAHDAPLEDDPNPKENLMKAEPVRLVLIPVALGAFVAAAQAWSAGADTRAIITAVLGVLIVAAQEYARSRVTPVPAGTPRADGGYGIVEAILIVFLVAVCLIVLFHFA